MRRREADATIAISEFEEEIRKQEDILYGLALFYEGIALLFEGQHAVIETYRKQFRNIIQNGKRVVDWAHTLVDEVRQSPRKMTLLEDFTFLPCHGHPNPKELAARATLVVETYNAIFPDRPREKALSNEEMLLLMETAGEKMGSPPLP